MRHHPDRGLLAATLIAVTLIAGGCSKNTSPTGPASPGAGSLTQSEANDVAVQTSFALDLIGLDVESAGSTVYFTGLVLRPGALPARAARDTTLTLGGLTAEVSQTFYNAAGDPLPGYGLTAARMNWRSHIWGTVESPRDTAAIQHHANLDFTGIGLGDSALVINGTCADTLLNRFRSLDSLLTRRGYWRSTTTAAAIVVRQADGTLMSGTLTCVAKVDQLSSGTQGDVTKSLSATVVVTFNGTRYPDVVVSGVHRFKWDMQHGTMTAV
jgi:hypothetical protein